MTTALEGGEWSASRPCRSLPRGKTRYPLYRRLGGPQGWSGQVWKISPLASSPQTVRIPTDLAGPLKWAGLRKQFKCYAEALKNLLWLQITYITSAWNPTLHISSHFFIMDTNFPFKPITQRYTTVQSRGRCNFLSINIDHEAIEITRII